MKTHIRFLLYWTVPYLLFTGNCLPAYGNYHNPDTYSPYPRHYIEYPADSLISFFSDAYKQHPDLPSGILEAIAYLTTRFKHRIPDTSHESCTHSPRIYGIMGLSGGGKNLKNGLQIASEISGIPMDEIINNPRKNILATAAWLGSIYKKNNDLRQLVHGFLCFTDSSDNAVFLEKDFLYQILKHINRGIRYKNKYITLPAPDVKPETYFTDDFAEIYERKNLQLKTTKNTFSDDYPDAVWVGTECYDSRNGTPITDVVIHDMEGYFTYTVYNWFQDCSHEVSAHYCIRSSDGFTVQLVAEADRAWHVGPGNYYSIGIEHEGFADDPDWYTMEMYNASAALVIDITQSGYGIDPASCYHGPSNPYGQTDPQPDYIRIKGHCHYSFSTHWDPGPNWNWYLYYDLINGNGTPDIVIMNMWTEPDELYAGDYADLYVTLKNVGDSPAESLHWNYYINGQIAGEDSHPLLNPGDTRTEFLNHHLFPDAGTYDYCVFVDAVENEEYTANNSYCTDITVEENNTSTSDPHRNHIYIYPNPAHDKLFLGNHSSDIKSFKLFDSLGRLLITDLTPHHKKWDISGLQAGIYFAHITETNGNTSIYRLIIK